MIADSPCAGEYDPIPAEFFSPNRELVDQSERLTGWTRLADDIHVRPMTGITREAMIQQRQEAAGLQVFRIRRNEVTEQFTHELGMSWRGRNYEVSGVGYPNLAEIELYAIPTTTAFTTS